MSFDALAWAGKQRPGSSARKLVLFALADRHNTEEGFARPSIKWISEWTDLNRKTVIAALQALEAAGLIADSGFRFGDTKQIKAYRLALETVPKAEPSQKRNSSTFSGKQSQKRDTDTIREPKGLGTDVPNPRVRPAAKPDPYPMPEGVDPQHWRDFLENRKRKRLPNTPTAHARLLSDLARLSDDEWPPGRLIQAAAERGWAGIYDPRESRNDDRTSEIGKSAAAFGRLDARDDRAF